MVELANEGTEPLCVNINSDGLLDYEYYIVEALAGEVEVMAATNAATVATLGAAIAAAVVSIAIV